MDNIIQIGDAAEAPVSDINVPVGNPSVPVAAGTGGLASPQGNEAIANEMGGTKAAGWPTGQTNPVEQTVPEYQQNTEPNVLDPVSHNTPAKEDPRRFEYWQSQADSMRGENQNLKQEIGDIKQYLSQREGQQSPSNPETNGSPVPIGNPQTELKTPVQPTKPSNYNEVDAFNDPNSASFQYRNQMDSYRDDVTTYMLQRERVREKQQLVQARRQQDFQVNQSAYNHATNNYGWDSKTANDFIEWSRNPANVTIDHLAKLYEMDKRGVDPRAQQKRQEMINQQERAQVPRTAQVAPSIPMPQVTDEQAFSLDLLRHSTKPK